MSNYYAPQGLVFIAPIATPTAFKWLCDCSALDLEFDSSVVSHQEGFSGLRANNASFTKQGGASLSITLDEINKNALEIGLGAKHESVAAGTVTAETLVFDENGYALLQKSGAAGVVLTTTISGTNGIVVDPSKYTVMHGAVIKLLDLSLLSNVVVANYTYATSVKSHIQSTLKSEYVLKYVAVNSAENNKPLTLFLNRVSFGMADKLSLISDDFGKFTIKGALSADPATTNSGPFGVFGYLGT